MIKDGLVDIDDISVLKEAIRHAFECTIGVECLNKPVEDFTYEELSDEQQEKAYDFQKGAEFGYNKANEWHYVKDGIMPAENQWVLVYDGSYTVCNYHSNTPIKWLDNYENEVYEGAIIAWCEIPKYIEE